MSALVSIARVALNPLFSTLRFEVQGAEHHEALVRAGQPFIYALWHGRLLPLCYYHRNRGIVALISASKDGDYLADFLSSWGFNPVRGSSSRGGREALRQLVRLARAGNSLAITPDGPRGPMQKLKPGVLVTAQLAGVPILPLSGATDRGWWPGKWDRFLVPKPFARIKVRYEAPMRVPRDASESDLQHYADELEKQLNRMTAELDASL